jgi:GMP synthase (glutamine-hydrolysing)
MSHVDSVARAPAGARVLARTALEPNAALRFAERVWSVQFHPEFDASVMRQYVEARRDIIAGEGLDPDAMEAAADDAPFGAAVLRRFLAMLG